MEQFLQFESHASVLPYLSFIDLILLLQVNRTCNRQVNAYWNKYSQRVMAQLIPPCLKWDNFKGIVYERARNYMINHQTFFPSITHLLWRIRGFAPRKKVWWNMWECRSCGDQSPTNNICARCEYERLHLKVCLTSNRFRVGW